METKQIGLVAARMMESLEDDFGDGQDDDLRVIDVAVVVHYRREGRQYRRYRADTGDPVVTAKMFLAAADLAMDVLR